MILISVENKHEADGRFDEFESIGKTLLSHGYAGQETFTTDDMIDAFMKGASVMNQFLGAKVSEMKYYQEVVEGEMNELSDYNQLLTAILHKTTK